jgi:hypothetical protein
MTEQRERAAHTPAGRKLAEMRRLMVKAAALGQHFLAQGHGSKCRCRFCAACRENFLDETLEDVRVAVWCMRHVECQLGNMLPLTQDQREHFLADSRKKHPELFVVG